MKNAIILMGAGENQESFWLPWLKRELEKKDYKVWLPQLPDNDNPYLTKTFEAGGIRFLGKLGR